MSTVALVLSSLALAVALTSAGLSVVVMRQSGAVATLLQRHRLGHEKREGALDPAPHTERRKLNVGPPRRTGERRDGDGRLLPAEEEPPAGLPTAEMTAPPPLPRLPRPGQIGRT